MQRRHVQPTFGYDTLRGLCVRNLLGGGSDSVYDLRREYISTGNRTVGLPRVCWGGTAILLHDLHPGPLPGHVTRHVWYQHLHRLLVRFLLYHVERADVYILLAWDVPGGDETDGLRRMRTGYDHLESRSRLL
jgi:hypothetical protein